MFDKSIQNDGLYSRLCIYVKDIIYSASVVMIIGFLIFALSGVWPPMVAVQSGSMNPNMEKGDLVFVSEPGRYIPDTDHRDTGIITYKKGETVDYRSFGNYGSVIVYSTPKQKNTPVIHRAHFWVKKGENWFSKSNNKFINANNCGELRNCPAPNSGFITKGDNNPRYDQASGIAPPVKSRWVVATAHVDVPYLGCVRLLFRGIHC